MGILFDFSQNGECFYCTKIRFFNEYDRVTNKYGIRLDYICLIITIFDEIFNHAAKCPDY